jgi:hypothetical protein
LSYLNHLMPKQSLLVVVKMGYPLFLEEIINKI